MEGNHNQGLWSLTMNALGNPVAVRLQDAFYRYIYMQILFAKSKPTKLILYLSRHSLVMTITKLHEIIFNKIQFIQEMALLEISFFPLTEQRTLSWSSN